MIKEVKEGLKKLKKVLNETKLIYNQINHSRPDLKEVDNSIEHFDPHNSHNLTNDLILFKTNLTTNPKSILLEL